MTHSPISRTIPAMAAWAQAARALALAGLRGAKTQGAEVFMQQTRKMGALLCRRACCDRVRANFMLLSIQTSSLNSITLPHAFDRRRWPHRVYASQQRQADPARTPRPRIHHIRRYDYFQARQGLRALLDQAHRRHDVVSLEQATDATLAYKHALISTAVLVRPRHVLCRFTMLYHFHLNWEEHWVSVVGPGLHDEPLGLDRG